MKAVFTQPGNPEYEQTRGLRHVPRVGDLVELLGRVYRVTEVLWTPDLAATADARIQLGKEIK